ncbi:alpha-hydroxy-acid oxidizing protein [Streptomyces griseoluteus]
MRPWSASSSGHAGCRFISLGKEQDSPEVPQVQAGFPDSDTTGVAAGSVRPSGARTSGGLAVGGSTGVRDVVVALRRETELAMALLGAGKLADLTPDLVVPHDPGPSFSAFHDPV